ncbi:rhomboid family intramembrane serine protease [Bartonella phoceensis]|uniref:rhomboid family intramembrane serine protease n=1 Tax=Bartonella phoceensis TaxID=270249 RepID=UPI001ABB170F|nr:rhomboid family intramembrane serine protease [Bartonella phoceensis]
MKDTDYNYNNVSFFLKQPPEPLLNVPFIVVVLITFCFFIYLISHYFFPLQLSIESLKIFSFTPVLFKTDPLAFCHTIISYSFMHSSFKHVAINMAWLLVFGSPLARQLGSLRFLMFWILTAIIAVLTYFTFHQESAISLVGASGAVCGMVGAIVRYGFLRSYLGGSAQSESLLGPLLSIEKALSSRWLLIFVSVWLSVDFIIGISSFLFEGDGISIAWEVHISGFFSGFLLIGFFDISRKKLKTTI